MPWGAAIGAGAALLGSSMTSNAATDAANTSAAAQIQAAQIAADAAKFRPVGVTTNFGTSNFQMDPNGYLQSAGYTLSPQLQQYQNMIMNQAGTSGLGFTGQGLQGAQSLFGLGQQYLAESPEAAAQKWLNSQRALLAPGREQAWANLSQGDYNRGTTGLKVAQGAGLDAANPYASALANSQSMQDLQLAAQAQEQGRNQVNFGAGLFGTGAQVANAGYAPFQTQVGLANTLEGLGQNALTLGSNLGGQQLQSGQTQATALLQGGLGAAKTIQGATSGSPTGSVLSGLSSNTSLMNSLGGLFSSSPTGTTFSGNDPATFDYAYGGGGWY